MRKVYLFYSNLKKNQWFYNFLRPAFFCVDFLRRRKRGFLRSFYTPSYIKKANSIHISFQKAKKQVDRLLNNAEERDFKQDFNPFVSIVILNRNGLEHLRRLMDSLKKNTNYSKFEIIVIDNDSRDRSVDFLKRNEFDLSLKVIKNKENVSFSSGCNQGAKEAKGELLVFMNNDIEVFPNWLNELVDCYLENKENIGSVGAKLIYPEKRNFKFSNRLQHVGIKFEFDPSEKFYRPYNFGMGESVLKYDEKKEYPALTAALLLVPKNKFEEVGGFDEKYFYGYEDVDFGLKLLKAGYKNISCSNACAFHYEFGTQKNDQNDEIAKRRKNNLEIFRKKWGAFLTKKVFENCLEGENFYCEEDLSVYLVFDEKNQEQAFEFEKSIKNKTDWKIKLIDLKSFFKYRIKNENGLLISFSSEYDIGKIKNESPSLVKIAWIENKIDEWLGKDYLASFDLIFSSEKLENKKILGIIKNNYFLIDKENSCDLKLQKIIEAVEEKKAKPKIVVKIPTPNWKEAESWGDYHFALSLEKYFKRSGWDVVVQLLPEWNKDLDRDCLVVLVLRGLSFYQTKPWHFNMMWNISHPDAVKIEEYESYDHVFIASRFWTEEIKKKTDKVKIETMLQCTDDEVFKIPKEEELEKIEEENILFVGNSRKKYRTAVQFAIESGFDVCVYGKLWDDFIDRKYIKGNYLPNEDLYKHYYLADVLLNDHWSDMAEKGFISNRLFDGMASGAILLTDYVKGIENEEFGIFLNIYKNKADFLEKVNTILQKKKDYKSLAEKLAKLIKQKHTFKKRTERFIEVVNECEKNQK